MEIKIFHGFENIYPEKIEGTNSWFYGQWTPCAEAYEVPEFKNKYPGTRLYLFEYPSGKVYEPIKQEKNVFLERPVYDSKEGIFGMIRYDFNKKMLEAFTYNPKDFRLKKLTELPFSKLGDMVNIRFLTSPFILVKYDVRNDAIDLIWPKESHFQFEENESLELIADDKMYTSKWMEDPEYHEEVIIRDINTGIIIERYPGYCVRMPNGSVWMMTQ